jgi:hypothetical protein
MARTIDYCRLALVCWFLILPASRRRAADCSRAAALSIGAKTAGCGSDIRAAEVASGSLMTVAAVYLFRQGKRVREVAIFAGRLLCSWAGGSMERPPVSSCALMEILCRLRGTALEF